ncbi:phosphotransferase family protein [Actinomadura gamaensis]|uniref:Phosphotransferase family protein n=1 Tax=Actinomadura gamaensis TaxID=1763541 RepID=A0ABV9TUI1_9ACTN
MTVPEPSTGGSSLFSSGPVAAGSPLASFLADEILRDRLGVECPRPRFQLTRIGDSAVLRCDEARTGLSLALKSYGLKWIDGRQGAGDRHALRARLMRQEFQGIRLVRRLGLDRPPLRAVRPLAVNSELGCLLVEEFVSGDDLYAAIRDAALEGAHAELDGALAAVARFLAMLHDRSPTGPPDDGREPVAYLEKITRQLLAWRVITLSQAEDLRRLQRTWRADGVLTGAPEVLVHGDATPTQFLFGDDGLVVIDFEKLHHADRAADIGRLAGELKHLFARSTEDAWASEPHIQSFYREYHRAAVPEAGDFGSLTERARFHMGCSELRIARNPWEEIGHRRWLTREAMRCLTR